MEEREVWRCPNCQLNQFASEKCRRCKYVPIQEPEPEPEPLPCPAMPVDPYLLGDRFRDARRFRKLSQLALALRMGVHRPYISKVERGIIAAPLLGQIQRIAEVLGIHPLFFMEPDPIQALAVVAMRQMTEQERRALLCWCELRTAGSAQECPAN